MAFYYPFIGGGATCNQIVTPLVYDESLSIAQQIACIMSKLNGFADGYLSIDEFKAFIDELNKEQSEQTNELKQYTDEQVLHAYNELMELIKELEAGMLVWNVVHGEYTNSIDAMRDMFNDVTVHGISVDTLAGLDITVDQLADSNLNVRGLAVYGGYLIDGFEPEGILIEGGN